MLQITKEFLNKLEQTPWFHSVGKAVSSTDDVRFVSTWQEAGDHNESEEYENAQIEASNELTTFLHNNHKEQYRFWNEKVKEIKPISDALVQRKVKEAEAAGTIPKNFSQDTFRWDILHICLALEYSDIIHTQYYQKLAHWYLSGHFPCGWEGDIPEDFEDAFNQGKLIVF